jgi:flagellar hook-length control protein FliK
MKVSGGSASAGGTARAGESNAKAGATNAKPGVKAKDFAKLLKGEGEESATMPLPPMPLQQGFSPVMEDHAAQPASAISPLIREIVQEIQVVTGPKGEQSVDVQFDSRTMQGLKVRISKVDEKVSIQFSCSDDAGARVLMKNLDQLSQALQAKGIPVASIRIDAGRPAATGQYESATGGERESKRDQRGDRQQKRNR